MQVWDAVAAQVVVHLDGSHHFFDSRSYEPKFAPIADGTRMVFSLFLDQSGQEDICTARSDGTDLINVTDTADFETPPTGGGTRWRRSHRVRAEGSRHCAGPKGAAKKVGLGGGAVWPRMRPSGFVDRGGSESVTGERHVRDSAG
jgi:hypothetical protein